MITNQLDQTQEHAYCLCPAGAYNEVLEESRPT